MEGVIKSIISIDTLLDNNRLGRSSEARLSSRSLRNAPQTRSTSPRNFHSRTHDSRSHTGVNQAHIYTCIDAHFICIHIYTKIVHVAPRSRDCIWQKSPPERRRASPFARTSRSSSRKSSLDFESRCPVTTNPDRVILPVRYYFQVHDQLDAAAVAQFKGSPHCATHSFAPRSNQRFLAAAPFSRAGGSYTAETSSGIKLVFDDGISSSSKHSKEAPASPSRPASSPAGSAPGVEAFLPSAHLRQDYHFQLLPAGLFVPGPYGPESPPRTGFPFKPDRAFSSGACSPRRRELGAVERTR